MDKFDALLEVAAILNGPKGCPWDRKQTFKTLQPYVIEEAHEVVEAVDSDVDEKIVEELGDLLYTIVFYAKLGEKNQRFTMEEVIDAVREKLIRRHPHVFGDAEIEHIEEVIHRWEKIKSEEKAHEARKSALDGIPKTLPMLVRAQKVVKKVRRSLPDFVPASSVEKSEEEIGKALLELVCVAEDADVDAESALRRALQNLEEKFRSAEDLA